MSLKGFYLGIALTLSLGLAAFAQPHLDLEAGVSQISGPDPGTGARMAYSVGVGYRYAVNSILGLDPILELTWQGEKDYGAIYATLPVFVTARVAHFEFGIGPYAAYGLWDQKNDPRYYDSPWNSDVYPYYEASAFGYLKRFDAGAACRLLYRLSGWYLGLEGSYGLMNSAVKGDAPSFTAHNMNLRLLLGVTF